MSDRAALDAALDAARVVFEPSIGRPPLEATVVPEWRATAPAMATPRGRGTGMWHVSELVLQAVLSRTELTGQALVGEARRRQILTLGDAHALVALQGWVDHVREVSDADSASPPSDGERMVAREAWLALEHASAAPIPCSPAVKPVALAATVVPPPGAAAAWDAAGVPPSRRWYASAGFLFGMLMVLVIGAAGTWLVLSGQRASDFDDGVAAYARGAREVARTAFSRAAQHHPDDARPLVYLGRLAREENDLPRARRFLEAAVRIDPANAVAQRELAAALLADGQPELARRFYVRALELDPTDRLSQGFLGCALYRLGRLDEAVRWVNRAGVGDWTPCVTVTAPNAVAVPPPSGVVRP